MRLAAPVHRKVVVDLSTVIFVNGCRSVEQRRQDIRLDVADLACDSVEAVKDILNMRGVDFQDSCLDNLSRKFTACNHTIGRLRYDSFKHKVNNRVQTFRSVAFRKSVILDIVLNQLAVRLSILSLISFVFDFLVFD